MKILEGLGGRSSLCVAGREQSQVLRAHQEKATFSDGQAGGTAPALRPRPALTPRGCRGPAGPLSPTSDELPAALEAMTLGDQGQGTSLSRKTQHGSEFKPLGSLARVGAAVTL